MIIVTSLFYLNKYNWQVVSVINIYIKHMQASPYLFVCNVKEKNYTQRGCGLGGKDCKKAAIIFYHLYI